MPKIVERDSSTSLPPEKKSDGGEDAIILLNYNKTVSLI